MAAKVVDLPLPVGPVTKTSPLLNLYKSITDCGTPNFSGSGILVDIKRRTKA